ncbi:MAG: phage portal protein [Rhizobiales bacterium 24-66-13]|jgi:HK97 family phage portal protein|nr:MAG: phage portal protein [Rhizobiales bacterium 35-66-30]OYZ82353.1 MAG: phage portal protein [Rhizobiales bacterium 24-66-13]OZB10715.1 MAG: phage portal protein [Rhizobiales bacterium 39-66-18]HQS46917.1 phage portal protein [Xanthobacteraceae bacterium]
MLDRPAPLLSYQRKSLSTPDAELLTLFGAGAPTAAGVTVSPGNALTVPAVACAVLAISEAAASLDVKVFRREASGADTEIPDHPAATLLRDAVNDWTDSFTFLRDLVAQALIYDQGGLAWVNRVNGRPVELIAYDSSHLTAQRHEDGTGACRYFLNGREMPPADIVHLRSPFGRSPLSLARESIGLALTLDAHAARLFGNGARPSGVLTVKGKTSPDAVRKIREAWHLAHGGANSGKTAIVEGETEYVSLTMSSVDAQFLELTRFQVLQIARAFRVPVTMLQDLERATWSNSEQMGREFLVYCLEPWLRALEGCLRRALFTAEEFATHRVVFDRDDLTRADIGARATAYSSLIASGVLNANEARGWEGLPARDGGDEFGNPFTTSATSAVAAAPQGA